MVSDVTDQNCRNYPVFNTAHPGLFEPLLSPVSKTAILGYTHHSQKHPNIIYSWLHQLISSGLMHWWCILFISFSFIKITILGTTKTQQIHSSISNLMIYSYKYPSFPSISPLFILRFPYKWLIVPGLWRRSAPEPALASPLRHATGRPGGRHGPLCAVPPGRCHDLSELQGHVGRPPATDRGALETGRFFVVKPVGIFTALWGKIEWDLVPSKRRI